MRIRGILDKSMGSCGMDKSWHPGMNVVCINNCPVDGWLNVFCHLLEDGRVYTVRNIINYERPFIHVGISLEEICHPLEQPPLFISWHPDRFRPCKLTSIESLREACTRLPPSKKTELV